MEALAVHPPSKFMPIYLFDGQTEASEEAVKHLHDTMDKQFSPYGEGIPTPYCGHRNRIIDEEIALAKELDPEGENQVSAFTYIVGYDPFDTELKGSKCHYGPNYIEERYQTCMAPVNFAKYILPICDEAYSKKPWKLPPGIDDYVFCGSGGPNNYDLEVWTRRYFAQQGPGRCQAEKEKLQEGVLWTTCDHTEMETLYTNNFGKTGHACASVEGINALYDYKFPEKSSAVAEREMNPKLDKAKADFLAPLISTIRSAYFLGGGIIGGWLVYLNAKSENLSFGENFLAKFPVSIPLIPSYSGGIGGSPA